MTGPDDLRHGTPTGFWLKCLCDACRAAETARRRKGRSHQSPARYRQRYGRGEDFGSGWVKTCGCGHAPGMHAMAAPEPCEVAGCGCTGLSRPSPVDSAQVTGGEKTYYQARRLA